MTYHQEMTDRFSAEHGCAATFLYTIPVRQNLSKGEVWDGAVWLFKLTGHPKAKFGYAWLHPNEANDDLVGTTILEMGADDSAQRAVKAAFDGVRSGRKLGR